MANGMAKDRTYPILTFRVRGTQKSGTIGNICAKLLSLSLGMALFFREREHDQTVDTSRAIDGGDGGRSTACYKQRMEQNRIEKSASQAMIADEKLSLSNNLLKLLSF